MATAHQANGNVHTLSPEQLDSSIRRDQENGRVAVHTFDPNASPAEKAAAAGKGRDQLKPANAEAKPQSGKAVAVDTGHSNIIPTITVEDADNLKNDPQLQTSTPQPPGAMPAGPAPPIPDWYKVGWRAVSGIDAPPSAQSEDKRILDLFLSEQYYGEWYHNAAVIIFAVCTAHFLTRFNLGWGWLLVLLAICNTYYTTSMMRVRRNARDDIQRELVKSRLASEHETAEWINNFLDRFWLIYEPVLSATVISSVDQILSTNTPPFLDSLRLSTFTLGTKAPRIDKVRTFPNTAEDIVMMDWGLSFTPNDVEDMTPRQQKNKTNPKIVLSVRVGKGFAGAAMPILIENIQFSALARVKLKLMTNFPHVQVLEFCFLEKPEFDYVLKPIGGETFGFDIGHMPGLSSFIREMVHATLSPMMYDPNVFTLNLEQMLSGAPIDAAIGVLQITVESARGIKGTKIGGGTPDPFVSMSINNRDELAKTKYKNNTYNPTWMETKFILVNSLTEQLVLSLFDYNDHRKNSLLGAATFELSQLEHDAKREGVVSPVLKDGKERGELRYDVSFYPVLKPKTVDGKEELPETSVGIVRLTIHQAKDLDHSKSMSGDLNPFARVLLGDSPHAVHHTARYKHTNNPVWESAFEFLCSDKASSTITVKVTDDRELLKDPNVGYLSIRLMDLLEAKKEAGRDWWPLSGCKSGRLRMSAEWKPLDMAGSLHGADRYVPPIGVIRLWLDKATDVKNVEATLGGKSDPYVRVQVNNVTLGRTEVQNNNLNPSWDQIVYIPVHSLRETVLLECMDYQHLTRDRSLGSTELRVSDLARNTSDKKYPYESTGKKEAIDPLRQDRGNVYKGNLHYTAEFVPAVALKGIKFESGPNEVERAAQGMTGGDDGGEVLDDNASIITHDSRPQRPTVTRPLEEDEQQLEGEIPDKPEVAKAKDMQTNDVQAEGAGTKEAKANGHEKTNGHVPRKSVDTVGTHETAVTAATADTSKTKDEEEQKEDGIEISKDELLKQQSGIIVFNIKSGQLYRKGRLEVLLDDGYWPVFSTTKARSTHVEWEHVGEGFIKELDFGRVWLRLNESEEEEKDDVIAEWKGDSKSFLEKTLDGPVKFTLMNVDEKNVSTVEIEARYVPVSVQLEPRESINNQGQLHIQLVDGNNLRAADRGGKSDPFAVFTLNGQKIFKSQTKKKTLHPEWDEEFDVSVPSRVAAKFSVEVFDWNQVEQAKSLGTGKIELADVEPFENTERVILLSSEKHGAQGEIRVRMTFRPEIIFKSRKNTSTFSAAGRAMTQISGLPLGAGKGVYHGVTGVFAHGKKEKDFAKQENGLPALPDAPAGQASAPMVNGSVNGPITSASMLSPEANIAVGRSDPGTLKVTVMDAKDLSLGENKPYVTVRLGDKEYKTKTAPKGAAPDWNESFFFSASSSTPKIQMCIYDHKTLGKDKVLGEAEIDIWRHCTPDRTSSAEVYSELRDGRGLLRLRLEFDAESARGSSISLDRTATVSTHNSPSKFSLRGGRKSVSAPDE